MKTIEVGTGRPYAIHIGRGLLGQFAELFGQVYGERRPKLAIITDDVVDSLYGGTFMCQLQEAGYETCKFVFPNGEPSKSLETVSRAYTFLSENGITRTDVIIALGGGVVGDLAGFAAATWLRSIDFVQVPTTFLAMIDSSVGGKTAVDIPQGKNLVGAFWQPTLVVCDPNALKTLPDQYYKDGVAEAIKFGAILDASLFELYERGEGEQHLEEIIARCVELKRQVVEGDERDKGIRQILNFGHTFGHAIEKSANFTITHGHGVSIGMVLISRACERAGITPAGTADRIERCLLKNGLPVSTDVPLPVLCQNCAGDKKRKGSLLTLIVLEEMGRAGLYPIALDSLYSFMGGEAE